jgi:hypothetical protein
VGLIYCYAKIQSFYLGLSLCGSSPFVHNPDVTGLLERP